ncbi:MAG: thymidylate kinase [Mollicutes bacterium]|nr:thymidylate kinase [Mollicutes bacterium]
MKGKIIVVEGTDCSGKETQSKLLEERLNSIGKKCVRFDFPNYESPTGKIIGGAYLGKPEIGPSFFKEGAVNVEPHVVCLYYAADRKYAMPEIEKYLNDDYYVILDRYTTSNLAHQGSKIHDKDERFNMYQWIDKLEYWLLGLPKPDKTIFLHVPLENTLELRKNRKSIDEHEKSPEYLKRAEESYLELSELYNWDKIECIRNNKLRSVEDINNEIMKIIEKMDEEK